MLCKLLGTGTSSGVPMPGCRCEVCLSSHPKNNRLRQSALITTNGGENILIDATTDLRQQALRYDIRRIDAVLYTHPHADHIMGTDDLRSFNFISKKHIPCYGSDFTLSELSRSFFYIFNPKLDHAGGGLPKLELNPVEYYRRFNVSGIDILPLPVSHGKMTTTGYRINNFAYLTDCNQIDEKTLEALQGLDTLILDALREKKHPSHFTIQEALEIAEKLQAKQTYFTHLSHESDYEELSKRLPSGIALAYDGLEFEVS